MVRSNPIYKARRLLQVLAYHILPHELLSKLYYRIMIHEKPDLKHPKTLNEKMQWLKLYHYPNDPLAIQCTDKYQVRAYIRQKGLKDKLTRLFGVWEDAREIDWDALPEQFVLKCTHGCANNIICRDKAQLDRAAVVKQLNKWRRENFAVYNVEPHYGKIKPRRIIAEEFLGDKLIDYKFFCFHGQPHFLYVKADLDHDRHVQVAFFDVDGNRLPLSRSDCKEIGEIELPACFAEMIESAKVLSADFPFVRVDFIQTRDSYTFSELTFTPSAAMIPVTPRTYDAEWGALLDLSGIMKGN